MQDEIDELRRQLNALRHDMQDRAWDLEQRILRLQERQDALLDVQSESPEPIRAPDIPLESPAVSTIVPDEEPVAAPVEVSPWEQETPALPRTPTPFARFLIFVFSLLTPILSSVFMPFVQLFEKGFELYQHYQREGKGPAFLMTATGIVALLFGSGYLLQYSFNHWFSDGLKLLVGYLLANAIIWGAIQLGKKQPLFADFAASLIGLGVVLNLLCTYFAAGYYHLISFEFMLLLLLLNIGYGYFLAKRYATHVVAVVSLLGGSLSPLLMPDFAASVDWYCAYLWILMAASLHLAHWLRWSTLTQLCMTLSVVILEYLALTLDFAFNWVLITHSFFFLYFVTLTFKQGQLRKRLSSSSVVAVTLNLLGLLMLLGQVAEPTWSLGISLLLDAAIFVGLFVCFPRLARQVKAILLLHAGLLAGLAVLVLFTPQIGAIVLAIEAFALIYLGCVYRLPSLRKEGVALLAYGWVTSVSAWWLVWSDWPLLSWHLVGFSVIFMALILWLLGMLLPRYARQLTQIELLCVYLARELAVLMGVVWLIYVQAIAWGEYALLSNLVLGYAVIALARRYQLVLSECMAWILLLTPLGLIVYGVMGVGSLHFSDQWLIARCAQVEWLIGLITTCLFYRHFYPDSRFMAIANLGRVLFFLLLPVVWLPSVNHHATAWLSPALWGAVVMALGFTYWTQIRWLRYQSLLLIVFSSFHTFAYVWIDYVGWAQHHAFVALFLGAVVFASLHVYARTRGHYLVHTCLRHVLWMAQYFWGASLWALVYALTGQVLFSLWALTLYWLVHLFMWPRWHVLSGQLRLIWLQAMLLSIAFLGTVWLGWYGSDGIGFMTWALLVIAWFALARYYLQLKLARRLFPRWIPVSYAMANALLFCGNILIFCDWLNADLQLLLTVAWVIQAITLLLLSVKPHRHFLQKQAVVIFALAGIKLVFVDIAGLVMIQKVIVLMLIGGLLLVGAYQFQRFKNQQN